jgi:hypothetical protein
MNIITLLWWSLGRGNPVVPSRWQATPSLGGVAASIENEDSRHDYRLRRS